ncbi:BTAD domain-containing putative transcriptional regulator [Dactylosporangium sp. NPDC048998]|uniref:AfsR/SARP family transcriptional regulator n=1 Tax=Dactylosporangium sp. NPDC048998 TaxID=3363976 RepID=UPI00372201F7
MRDRERPAVRFSVLGPVRGWEGDAELDLGAPQQRALFALLLVHAGQPVPLTSIVDVLWPAGAPATAVNIVHRYVSRLRRLVPDGTLARSSGGYRLDLDDAELDLLAFRRHVAEARSAAEHDPHSALASVVQALRMWRGPVAVGVEAQIRAAPAFAAIDQEIADVLLQAAGLAEHPDCASALLPFLRQGCASAPLDEPMHAALIRTLGRSGRQAEAFAAFAALRGRLVDELGVDPGPEVAAAHRDVLLAHTTAQTTPHPASPQAQPTGPGPVGAQPTVRPAQLPMDLPTFSGRAEQMQHLTTFLRGEGAGPTAARVAVISGMSGVGKTTLAVHCAHVVAADFPDGQLYVNMRGFDPSARPLPVDEAVRGFLAALGVPDSDLPAGLDEQVALYRTMTSGRRIVVVLDNVRDTEHARVLLPGAPECVAIVTSRHLLTGLVIREGADPTVLEPMSAAESETFLERRLGRRSVAEPAVTRQIVALCGGLPLALAIFSARATTHPHFTLHELTAELQASLNRLDAFDLADGTLNLRVVFSWSYQLLTRDAAELFRLLSLDPGPTLELATAASLAGRERTQTRDLLAELARANLVTELAPGRFRVHDLVRAYSAELLHSEDPPGARQAASARLLDHYVHSSLRAAVLINPRRRPEIVGARAPLPGVTPHAPAGYSEAVGWFFQQRSTLLKMIDLALAAPADPAVWQLAWSMENYLQRHHYCADWESAQQAALTAARRAGDVGAQARAQHGLGIVYSDRALNIPERSRTHLLEAIRLFGESGDALNQATVHLRYATMETPGSGNQQRHVAEALRLYHERERQGYTDAHDYIAAAYVRLGDYKQALPYALAAVDLLERVGDRHHQACAWSELTTIYTALGDDVRALGACERSVTLFLDAGDRFLAADELEMMARRYANAGRPLFALNTLRRALALYSEICSSRAASVRAAITALAAEAGWPTPAGTGSTAGRGRTPQRR